MFKICLLFAFLALGLSIFGQTTPQQTNLYTAVTPEQVKALEEVQKLNLELAKLYRDNKDEEAAEIGKIILETVRKNVIESDLRVLPSLRNVAETYLVRKKYNDAIKILESIITVYEKIGSRVDGERSRTLGRLAYAYTGKRDLKNAEAAYLKVIALNDSIYGAKSVQSADSFTQLASVYQLMNNDEQATAYFTKAVEVNDIVLTEKEKESRHDLENFRCFSYHSYYRKKRNINMKEDNAYDLFMKKRNAADPKDPDEGVVNGKAINLVKPVYPQRARDKRAEGFAIVHVEINEQGNVTSAKAYCGFLDFVKEVEKAAMASTFSPTTLKGVPTKVTGDIVYNFTAK